MSITILLSEEAFTEIRKGIERNPAAGEQLCTDLLEIRELRVRRGVPRYESTPVLVAASEPTTAILTAPK